MMKSEEAVELMKNGSSCAQAVLQVVAEEIGLEREVAHKIMTAFGGGMGRKQYVCGAVSGGVAALNMRYGNSSNENVEGKKIANEKVNRLFSFIENKWGSSDCRSLLGYDFTDEAAAEKAKEEKLTEKVCHNLVRDVVSFVEAELNIPVIQDKKNDPY